MEGSSSTQATPTPATTTTTTTTTNTTNTPPTTKIKKRGAPRKPPREPAPPRPKPRPYRRVTDSDLTSRISDMQRKLELLKSKSNLLEDRLIQHEAEKQQRTEDTNGAVQQDTKSDNL